MSTDRMRRINAVNAVLFAIYAAGFAAAGAMHTKGLGLFVTAVLALACVIGSLFAYFYGDEDELWMGVEAGCGMVVVFALGGLVIYLAPA